MTAICRLLGEIYTVSPQKRTPSFERNGTCSTELLPKYLTRTFIHYPFFIMLMNIDGTIKCIRPFIHIAIVVRMREGDCTQSSFRFYKINGGIIEERNAVP